MNSIQKSELRIMFRLYYIDGLTWVQVAHRMNRMFPKRRIKFTDDNCWRRNQRFFENVGSCRKKNVSMYHEAKGIQPAASGLSP